MISSVIKKEMLGHILSARYILIFCIFLLLPFLSTIIRTDSYKKQLKDYQDAVVERKQILTEPYRYFQSRGLGMTVEKEPNALAIFSLGLENEMTRSYTISDWSDPRTGERKFGMPIFRYFFNLDMVLIINIICSLLAMLLVFDAICGEREQGTLKVLLSGPIPRDTLIVGKLLSGLLTLMIPLLISWVISFFYVLVLNKVTLNSEQIARLGWIVFTSVLYISCFFALGIAVSSWVQRSATSLAICIFCWIVFVLAIPNVVPMVARYFAQIPARSKIMLEKDSIVRNIKQEMVPKWRDEVIKSGRYPDEGAVNKEVWNRFSNELYKQYSKLDRYYNNQIENQLKLNQYISRISPSAAYTYSSTHFAGTGVQDFLRLLSEVDNYQRDFLDAQQEQERKRNYRAIRDANWNVIDRYDPTNYPSFKHRTIHLAKILNESWIELAMLSGLTILLFLFAFLGFMRYDPQ